MTNLFGSYYSIPAWIKVDESSTLQGRTTYPTLRKGTSSSNTPWVGICDRSQEVTRFEASVHYQFGTPLETKGNMEDAIKVAKDAT